MIGAVAVAALVGLASLLTGVALGWHLCRTNNRCPDCGDRLACAGCGEPAPRPHGPGAAHTL
ncbi:hypothetical protein EV385_2560 [Krasilnikovia cinnamomea]|uniref:Uncharacterized protein n=1 Tax=Krasilnikovia cinnamomea TaxID=349313 RepID=A0A4Q7ZIU6_9ACTN|nr:hypothetical protein [Krasilnikovia cinnamomea]RZU50777.1 hypothetical protein EV385_2560 [Krasilnikovia cinnamomea]